MALFMDFHEDLKLPAEALAQIAEDARYTRADRCLVPATTRANPRSGERHGREPGSHPAGQPQPR